MDTDDIMFWLKSLLYGKEYVFTQPEPLVKFNNQHGMYRFRITQIAKEMRNYDNQKNHQNQ